jgi:hypothetical protein
VFAGKLLYPLVVGGDFGLGHLPAELFVSFADG